MQMVRNFLLDLQTQICQTLEQYDTQRFITDNWEHKTGGGGKSRILRKGSLFDSAGVNFSHVFGPQLPNSATVVRPELKDASFEAMGVSLVIHPHSPFVPTTHANFRWIKAKDLWWFGGGLDLTPYYGFMEDAIHWHKTAYEACKPFGEAIYPLYKKNCDDYFYLKHRNETRGIGGLFFDDLNTDSFENCFALVQSIANSFLKAYIPIVEKRKSMIFNQAQKDFQLMRRGRYVEFNLLYDRGTFFGLQSGGRLESIFMSLPPSVNWEYNWQPQPGTPEFELTDYFLKPQDWLGLTTKKETANLT